MNARFVAFLTTAASILSIAAAAAILHDTRQHIDMTQAESGQCVRATLDDGRDGWMCNGIFLDKSINSR